MSLKEKFTDKVCGMYNTEMFFIEDCSPNKSKYTKDTQMRDMQLSIILEENNFYEYKGCIIPYCTSDGNRRKVKLKNITEVNQPELNITNNNYIIEDDTWESFQL